MTSTRFGRFLALVLFIGVFMPVVGGVASLTLAPGWRWHHVPLHAVVEAVGGIILLALAGVLLVSPGRQGGGGHRLWVSSGLISMGIFGLAHAAIAPGSMFAWFHSVATFAGGILFALVWLPVQPARASRARLAPLLAAVATLVVCACSLVFPRVIPTMVEQGAFTPAARGLSILGGLGFVAAGVWFLRRCRSTDRRDDRLFAYLCCLFGAAGMLFELSVLWDAAWWWWHLLRLAAYSLALCYSGGTYYRTNRLLYGQIAERERVEAALRASEERFHQIADNAQEWIWEIDDQGMYTYASPAVTSMLGYHPGELVGKKHFYDMFHPDDCEELKKTAFEVFARKKPFREFINRNVRKDGTIAWLSTSGVPVIDERGHLCGCRGGDKDITDRKHTEEALEAERQQLSSMFDGMEELVYVSDPESHELLYMNGTGREQWGDRAGEKCHRVLQNRDLPCPFCTNDRIFGESTGRPYTWEFQNEVTQRWYRCFDRAIRWSDGRMVRFEMAIDIHEGKQAEEELNQRVREVSEAKHRLEVLVSGTTGREQRMVDLKQEVNDLLQALGREIKYQSPRQIAELSTGIGAGEG